MAKTEKELQEEEQRKLLEQALQQQGEGSQAGSMRPTAELHDGGAGNTANNPNYDPNIDYSALAGDLAGQGNWSGAWDALFGSSNSREAKIAGMENFRGQSSDDIWKQLVQRYSAGGGTQGYQTQLQAMLAQLQGSSPSYQPTELDGQYADLLREILGMDYTDWTQGDQYAALSDRYNRLGRQAADDMLGKMSARTGGLASSYAGSVSQQQLNEYLMQLEDAAMKQYASERGDKITNLGLLGDYNGNMFNRWLQQQQIGSANQQNAAALIMQMLSDSRADDANSRTEAQNRILAFLQAGGSIGDLDPNLVTQSGFTMAELQAYANQAGGGSGGGYGGTGGNGGTGTGSGYGDSTGGRGEYGVQKPDVGTNHTSDEVSNWISRLVDNGILTPDQAADLWQEWVAGNPGGRGPYPDISKYRGGSGSGSGDSNAPKTYDEFVSRTGDSRIARPEAFEILRLTDSFYQRFANYEAYLAYMWAQLGN